MDLDMCFPAFLFDYNGVLVDDELVHLDAYRAVLSTMGLTLSERDYWDKYLGFDDAGAFEAILAEAGLDCSRPTVARLVEAKRPVYLELAASGLKTFEGASELIRGLARHAIVGVVSGALRDEIELGLDVLGAKGAVSFIVSAEDTVRSKPDPEGYNIGKAKIASLSSPETAAQALVIEDSFSGVEAAKAAGLTCLGLCHTYSEAELRASGADAVLAKLSDVTPELLATLFGGRRA